MTIVGRDMDFIYRDICKNVHENGSIVTVRDLTTRELINVQVQLIKPRNRFINYKARDVSMRYLVGELCHYLDGRTDLASIAHYAKFWEKVSDDGKTINSAYGSRLFSMVNDHAMTQFQYAVGVLLDDSTSRKAVMMIYRPNDARASKDNPCTLSLQLLVRNNELCMFTNMRSQDVWLGVPYDFAFFTIVQEAAYVLLLKTYPKLRLGPYYHNVTSLHLYANNFEASKALIKAREPVHMIAPKLTDVDVDTWFDDLLTYEKYKRGKVLYKNESKRTDFQDWCKTWL